MIVLSTKRTKATVISFHSLSIFIDAQRTDSLLDRCPCLSSQTSFHVNRFKVCRTQKSNQKSQMKYCIREKNARKRQLLNRISINSVYLMNESRLNHLDRWTVTSRCIDSLVRDVSTDSWRSDKYPRTWGSPTALEWTVRPSPVEHGNQARVPSQHRRNRWKELDLVIHWRICIIYPRLHLLVAWSHWGHRPTRSNLLWSSLNVNRAEHRSSVFSWHRNSIPFEQHWTGIDSTKGSVGRPDCISVTMYWVSHIVDGSVHCLRLFSPSSQLQVNEAMNETW